MARCLRCHAGNEWIEGTPTLEAEIAETTLRAAAREALDFLTRLTDSASEWQVYALPADIVSEIDAAKARLAGVLNG